MTAILYKMKNLEKEKNNKNCTNLFSPAKLANVDIFVSLFSDKSSLTSEGKRVFFKAFSTSISSSL